jgi:hypothetical protein
MKYKNELTFIIRDDSPMINAGDFPSYRTVKAMLHPFQFEALQLRKTEEISRVILEEKMPELEKRLPTHGPTS